ncbi:MAG: 2-amino-4-hydroxy-6-hydroxymethyldihydropteridine diphosphokinase, partial [Bacteroidales bacterium]|nr:2-amino-4-hydroxy-6-hydroxymethyldihydropteridine diphosphokinase [Bacteroidales bacterium]
MKPVPVYFSLGTNLGDRRAQIEEALRRLDALIGRPYEALSSLVETPAWGFDGPDFLNCVVRYRTARRPQTLLRICKRIEREMGRRDAPEYDAEGRRIYHDRPIDIDILLYG